MSGLKGLSQSTDKLDGSDLRVLIVHTRWNTKVIEALVKGAVAELEKAGVKKDNIVIQDVPGSYELPLACSRLIAAAQVQSSANAADLMGGMASLDPLSGSSGAPTSTVRTLHGPFSSVIAIGTLIKGSTQHFEYISESVSHGLMRVQLDTGVPVIYGVLNCLTDEQALSRAGIAEGENKGHNHGEDWGQAAVELGVKTRRWQNGQL